MVGRGVERIAKERVGELKLAMLSNELNSAIAIRQPETGQQLLQ